MNEPRSIMGKYGEWIFRAILLVTVLANLWLTRNFVTRPEFESLSLSNTKEHLVIQTTISDISTTMKLMARNETKLDDHESRIRLLENRQTDVLARLPANERDISDLKGRVNTIERTLSQ